MIIPYLQVIIWWRYMKIITHEAILPEIYYEFSDWAIIDPTVGPLASSCHVPYRVRRQTLAAGPENWECWSCGKMNSHKPEQSHGTTRLKVSQIRKIKPKDRISMCFSRLAQAIPGKLRPQRLQHDWAADKIDATQTAGHPQLYKMPICCDKVKGLSSHRVHSGIYVLCRISLTVPVQHIFHQQLSLRISVGRTWGSHCSVLVDLSVAAP